MTKIINILFSLIVLASCSDKDVVSNKEIVSDKLKNYGDTIIGSKSVERGWAIKLDSKGNFEYLLLGSGPNQQYIYMNEFGFVDQIETYKDDKVESYLQFYPNGQLKKLKWKDGDKPFVNDQDIEFSSSQSKSLMINENESHAPIICGLRDTFEISSNSLITFKDLFSSDPTKYEVEYIIEQSPNLKTEIAKDKSGIYISADKSGTYRLVAKVRTTFLPNPNNKNFSNGGTFFKIDLDLIFKKTQHLTQGNGASRDV